MFSVKKGSLGFLLILKYEFKSFFLSKANLPLASSLNGSPVNPVLDSGEQNPPSFNLFFPFNTEIQADLSGLHSMPSQVVMA